MRASRWVLAVFATMVLAMPTSLPATASAGFAAPSLYRLNVPTARGIAEKLVRKAVRRSPRLDTAALRTCARGLRGVDCLFIARGQTANAEFDCRFKVVVRSGHRRPSGKIVARTCQVTLRPLLTATRAREAIASVAESRIGSDGLIELARISRSMFVGYAPWPPGTDGPICLLKLTAELLPSDAVLVKSRGLTCAA